MHEGSLKIRIRIELMSDTHIFNLCSFQLVTRAHYIDFVLVTRLVCLMFGTLIIERSIGKVTLKQRTR